MADKRVDKILQHIDVCKDRLCCVDNNLRYIKVLQSAKYWMDMFDKVLCDDEQLKQEYSSVYQSIFFTGFGWSDYERVCLSIQDYKYGNKPF